MGENALYTAAENNHAAICVLLLKHGADTKTIG